VLWVEEPLPADDLAGHRALAKAFPRLIATGEHLQGMAEALPYIEEGLLGMVQPDLAAMGGLTECLRVMRVAEAFGMEASGHFLPGLFIHVAAAAPNLTWLEEFPMLEPLFTGWPQMSKKGTLTLPGTPGHGLALAEDALTRFAV
jgi:L-alanine-DL-glutamate epimerase-like enolase superfamily enzyme